MSILLWLIVGGIVGWLASLITNTDKDMGIMANVIVGIVGSIIGGTLYVLLTTGSLNFNSAINGFDIVGLIVSIIGAVLLLMVLKAFNSTRTAARV